jgi:hypothetical protein
MRAGIAPETKYRHNPRRAPRPAGGGQTGDRPDLSPGGCAGVSGFRPPAQGMAPQFMGQVHDPEAFFRDRVKNRGSDRSFPFCGKQRPGGGFFKLHPADINIMNATIRQWPIDTFVLIPSYKAAVSLKTLLPRIQTLVPSRNICVVDDGSLDGTNLLCRDLGIRCIAHYSNQGKGASLWDGFRFLIKNCDARWIVTMDADGQHAIEDVPRFIDSVKQNPSSGMWIGMREKAIYKMPISRILSNSLTSFILSVLVKQRIHDCQCGFRIYSRRLLESVMCKYSRFEMESEIILRAAHHRFPIKFVKVQTLYFNENSHISHVKDTVRWLRAVTDVWLELHKNTRASGSRSPHPAKN